ncbi:MAG TPA: DUF72 domain-containing protein [Gemmatimonadales bacterium]|nr:DUF72 domain-containing protein [Gemmatimonadales bacterium]
MNERQHGGHESGSSRSIGGGAAGLGERELAEFAALRSALPSGIRFGTSSWNYPGWQGLVYRRSYGTRGASGPMLEEYARFPLFGVVGLDASYYAPTGEATYRDYAVRLPPGYPVVSKVWQQLTVHTWGRAQGPAKAGKRNPDFLNPELFLDAVYRPARRHFAEHQGPFVFELQAVPRSAGVGPEGFARMLDDFFAALPSDGRYAVELRNPEFLTPEYYAVLRAHRVAHVFNSWTRMPSIGEQLDLPGSLTAPFVVARALMVPGRGYEETVDAFAPFDRIREPAPEVRRDLVRLAVEAIARTIPAFVLVNNRLEGCAPRTIEAVVREVLEVVGRSG